MRIIILIFIIISLLAPNALMPFKAPAALPPLIGAVNPKTPVQPLKSAGVQPAQFKRVISAWVPYWDNENVARSFRQNKKMMNEISPYMYFTQPNGQLKAAAPFNMALIREAKREGIKVIPMTSNDFDGAMISRIINNPQLRKAHINALVEKTVKGGFDGIDLDYEGLLPKDRKMISYFVHVLADKLHARGKLLSVTLQAKTKEPGNSNATKAQDWRELGKYADRLRIMAYDHHWKTSGPGPIAPRFWVEQVAKFASRTIPARKVIMAFGTYGYNWDGSGRAKAMTIAQVRALSKAKKQPIQRDPKSSELFLKLGPGAPRIWLQDSGSLKAKLEVVKKYNLGGVVFWRLGDEDAANWQVLKEELG